MNDDAPSKRQQRKAAREGARKLARDPAWQKATADPMQKLRQLDQELRDDRVYADSGLCEACATTRRNTGDDTALCEDHLAEAMGF